MIRTQIQLTEKQSSLIKKTAAEQHISMAECIRRGIEFFLRSCVAVAPEDRYKRAINAAGRFGSGKSNISAQHDQYLAEAYEK